MSEVYYKNRLTIKARNNLFIYKFIYNPYLVSFYRENSDDNIDLTFDRQFDDLSVSFYQKVINEINSSKNSELLQIFNNVDKYLFFSSSSDALYIDFEYNNEKLVYQFVTKNNYPKNWFEYIKSKYNQHLEMELEYIIDDKIYNNDEKYCCLYKNNKQIYTNLHKNNDSYVSL